MIHFFKFLKLKINLCFCLLMTCSFTLIGQTNYGNFSATSSQNVGIGGPITSYKLYVRGTSNDGIYVYTNKTNGQALRAYAPTSGYAAYLLGNTYVSAKMGIGIDPKNTQVYEKLAISGGSFATNGEGNGLSLNTSNTINDWGTRWYGLFKGNHNSLDLATGSSQYHDPIILSSFYGLGFKTIDGSMTLNANGSVAIGLSDTKIEDLADITNANLEYNLYVTKGIRTQQVRIDLDDWADYVFEEDYQLRPLSEVEQFIEQNGHLPEVPSAEKVAEEGIDLGSMDATLLKKIEELTLYLIDIQKKVSKLEEDNSKLKQKILLLDKK